MRETEVERLLYVGLGPLLAIGLGMVLVPLRGVTSASNFSFAFLALTIVVAEYGGRAAALATAVAAALSLDFFLTRPYLRLEIADKHDVIAFAGLAACGLIVAALGSQRGEQLATLSATRRHGELLHGALRAWSEDAPAGPRLEACLRSCVKALPVAALALRDDRDCVLAASGASAGLRAVPETVLQPDTLAPADGRQGELPPRPLPEQGGRLALVFSGRRLGWLDVWGNGAPADAESRRALSDAARLLATLLAGTQPAPR